MKEEIKFSDMYLSTIKAVEYASYWNTRTLLYNFKLVTLAYILKNRFKDKRTLKELVSVIKEEYSLT